MELTGRLLQKLAVQSGTSARGQWAKQEFVIEYQDGNFPTKACFSVWGQDKVQDLERFQINDEIKVEFNVSSREYNGKWYTDLRAWRISRHSRALLHTSSHIRLLHRLPLLLSRLTLRMYLPDSPLALQQRTILQTTFRSKNETHTTKRCLRFEAAFFVSPSRTSSIVKKQPDGKSSGCFNKSF